MSNNPARQQRSPAEIEDIILRKIFLVTLTEPPTPADARIAYLELAAAEILSEGRGLRLSRDLLERVLIDRLSGSFPGAEPPFEYLIGCYRRVFDELKKISSMKNATVRSQMEDAVQQARKLCVSYCRIHLSNPEMFSGGGGGKGSSKSLNVSPLLPYVFGEVSTEMDGFITGSSGSHSVIKAPPGFVDEFFKEGDYDSLENILKQLYEDLRGAVLKVSALGNFQQPLRALMLLVNYPVGAKALINHLWWIPKGAYLNGRSSR